jgi:hypothetical protein
MMTWSLMMCARVARQFASVILYCHPQDRLTTTVIISQLRPSSPTPPSPMALLKLLDDDQKNDIDSYTFYKGPVRRTKNRL